MASDDEVVARSVNINSRLPMQLEKALERNNHQVKIFLLLAVLRHCLNLALINHHIFCDASVPALL